MECLRQRVKVYLTTWIRKYNNYFWFSLYYEYMIVLHEKNTHIFTCKDSWPNLLPPEWKKQTFKAIKLINNYTHQKWLEHRQADRQVSLPTSGDMLPWTNILAKSCFLNWATSSYKKSDEWCVLVKSDEWCVLVKSDEWCVLVKSDEWCVLVKSDEWCVLVKSDEWCVLVKWQNKHKSQICTKERKFCIITKSLKTVSLDTIAMSHTEVIKSQLIHRIIFLRESPVCWHQYRHADTPTHTHTHTHTPWKHLSAILLYPHGIHKLPHCFIHWPHMPQFLKIK